MEFVRPQAELCHGSPRRAYTAAMPGFAHVVSDPCLDQGDASLTAFATQMVSATQMVRLSCGSGRRLA